MRGEKRRLFRNRLPYAQVDIAIKIAINPQDERSLVRVESAEDDGELGISLAEGAAWNGNALAGARA